MGNFGNMSKSPIWGAAKGALQGWKQASQQPQQDDRSLSTDTTAKIRSSTDTIKQHLARTMHNVVSMMKDNRDSVGYQVANLISQRLGGMLDNLPWRKGSGKFDRNTAFGQQPTKQDRWKNMMGSPEQQQRMATTYAQKLQVNPRVITSLIQQGFKDPSMWPGIVEFLKKGGRLNANMPKPQQQPQAMPPGQSPQSVMPRKGVTPGLSA
jgi:hypothetical protein